MNLILFPVSFFILSSAIAQDIKISKTGPDLAYKGPVELFNGKVTITPLFVSSKPSRSQGASVSFEPKARAAWHTHPLGQTLIVTDGEGYVRQWNGKTQFIKKGDVVWTPPGIKHSHGATPNSGMTHIAIQEEKDGKVVEWMEKVSDDEYAKIMK